MFVLGVTKIKWKKGKIRERMVIEKIISAQILLPCFTLHKIYEILWLLATLTFLYLIFLVSDFVARRIDFITLILIFAFHFL